ncbi:hypothetical protein [Nonomuraea zeae]|uniref:Uncharacterized protein n=1 Tax=Nonomuraea zeae TaxID=1642303 RepID=A0A5S4GV07_9ACTN|nr:hypothetical protein [Nonomuraea zeae]TMR36599.1 hypothetical protein ETD85_10415 [Nonomuraea zeae]
MLAVLGIIGSLVVIVVLVLLAVLLISVAVLVALAVLAGSMADWRAAWRRLTYRQRPLTLKLSGSTVPKRRRAALSGSTPRLRRRFRLGGAPPGERRPGGAEPHRARIREPRLVARRSNH